MVADATLSIHTGSEISVAATKTFVTTLNAGFRSLAELQQDAALITAIVSRYAMVETDLHARGFDPDAFRHLNKVTETI